MQHLAVNDTLLPVLANQAFDVGTLLNSGVLQGKLQTAQEYPDTNSEKIRT
jgi:hypothetical protein